jgi:hypothetical protein
MAIPVAIDGNSAERERSEAFTIASGQSAGVPLVRGTIVRRRIASRFSSRKRIA